MYRIKTKEYLYQTSITLQRKLFGMWIYWDGWNVKSTSDHLREREVNKIIESLHKLNNVTDVINCA